MFKASFGISDIGGGRRNERYIYVRVMYGSLNSKEKENIGGGPWGNYI